MPAIEMSDTPSPLARVRRKRALWIAAIAFVWWVLDLNLAATILVTPLPGQAWWLGTLVGMIAGLATGHAVAAGEILKPPVNGPAPRRRPMMIMCCVIGLCCGAVVANRATWRFATTLFFWGSSAPISVTPFPIRSVNTGRGGPTVSIGSNGEPDTLPISKYDLKLLGDRLHLQRPWLYCLNLRRQEQGDAVRIWRPWRPRLTSKKLTVTPCPANVWWI